MSRPEDTVHDDSSEEFVCSDCGKEVDKGDDFCPHCGAILTEGIFCDKHRHVEASGVCVVCGVPCCDDCGSIADGMFLCNQHADYEIFEGMVKVYGTHTEADAELAKSRLEDAGMHPALLHLRRSKDRGHIEYEPCGDGENFDTSEIKVMVPCEEVDSAENILRIPAANS